MKIIFLIDDALTRLDALKIVMPATSGNPTITKIREDLIMARKNLKEKFRGI